MRKFKLFFACLLMTLFSIGQVWATEYTATYTVASASSVNASGDYPDGSSATLTGNASLNGGMLQLTYGKNAVLTISGYEGCTITGFKMSMKSNSSKGKGSMTLVAGETTLHSVPDAAFNTSNWYGSWSTSAVDVDFTSVMTTDYTVDEDENIVITVTNHGTSNSTNSLYIGSYTITYEVSSSGGSTPSLSVSPTSWDFGEVAVSDEASKVFSVSGSNLTAGTLSISVPEGFSVSPSSISVTEATLAATNVTVSKNTTTIGEYGGNLSIAGGGQSSAKTVALEMNVVADPEPTGTFELFSGALEEGDYVIVYDNAALNTTVSSNRLGYTGVTPAENKITNPDGSLVWHIAPVSETSYWTLYNAVEEKYAASTSSKNQATMAGGDMTDNKKWTVTGSSTYDFENLARSNGSDSGNKWLRKNGTYGFACYASGTGGALTLYKKSDGKKNTGLAYSIANYLVKAGASLATPTLTNPNSLTGITYASSDADVVAVNETTGALTIKAAGKAVITASRAADDTYKAGSASYAVYVAEQAGTAADPLTEASAKALIDLGCTMDAHVHGVVTGSQAANFTVTLANGFQFYKLKDLNNVAFESAYLKNGDEVTAVGTLTKYGNSTYELAEGCYLTAYTEYTEPLVDISNTKATAYTVAQALALATNPTSDLTKAVYIAGVVYDVKSFNSTNGTLDIYIKDAGENNKFEFYKCAGIYDESLTAFTAADDVQVGDEVIGYGVMKYYSGGSIWEFDNTATGDYLVELTRPEIAVSSVGLDQDAASIEVDETVTLTATVSPDNASNKAITWSIQSGSTYASVENGVVTGLIAGQAVIRAASTADPTKYAECTVTVTAADPSKHVVTFDATVDQGESPLSKSNISMACSNGVLNNGTEYRLYKSSTTTFECSVGNITKVEFTGVSGNPVSGFGDPEVGTFVTDGNDGVWTGNAASVTFTASGAQVRATEIKVTYKEDTRDAAGLTWSTDAVVLTVGDAFTAPTLNNPNSIAANEITIASDNTALAQVENGVVSLVANATGEATITATFAGNDDYKPATVSYTITVNEVGLDNVTFDATIDIAGTNELSITKGGFTLEFTGGAMGNGSEYRLYKNETMKLSSTAYYIKKIEFTCTSGNPISGFADAEGLDKDNNQWTGQANSVELTASGAQVRIEKLKVYYIEDTRTAAGLAWSTDEVEITLGDAFTAATLQNPNSISASAITIESDNENLAEVNEGVVSLVANATGTAHITATFAGNATYKPASVSYTIIVNDPTPEIITTPTANLNFGSVEQGATINAKNLQVTLQNVATATVAITGEGAAAFSADPMALSASGTITVSASSANIGTFAATLTISDDANQATAKEIHLSLTVTEPEAQETAVSTSSEWVVATEVADGLEVLITGVKSDVTYAVSEQATNNRTAAAGTLNEGIFTPGENTMSFTLVAQGEGTYALRTSNGKYLYAASSSANQLKTRDAIGEDGKAVWSISIGEGNVASIVANCTTANWRNTMQFNQNGQNNPMVACYASASQSGIKLYIPYVAPQPQLDPIAEIGGKFIINAKGDTAVFSRGNLQYQQSTNTWRCAPNQYEWAGEAANEQMGNAEYAGWVDLFSWSLGAENNYGATSAYLTTDYQNKSFVDWGTKFEGNWSTLSSAQWSYLLNTRSGADDKWGMAMIGDTLGMILLPEEWTAPSGVTFVAGNTPNSELWDENDIVGGDTDRRRINPDAMEANKFTIAEWEKLEATGAIFLPYAGRRSGGYGNHTNTKDETVDYEFNYTYYENYLGTYWTSTVHNAAKGQADYLYTFNSSGTNWGKGVIWSENGRYGQSVRLVHIIPRQYMVAYDANGATGTVPVDGNKYLDGAEVTLAAASGLSKEGYVFAGWKFKDQIYNGTYTVNNVLADEEIVFEAQWEPDWQTVRTGLEIGRYYTICLPNNIMAAENASFWNLRYKNAEPATMVYLEEVTELEAGKPYIFQAESEILKVVLGNVVAAQPIENGALRGTFEYLSIPDFDALPGNVYILQNNEIHPRLDGANWLSANRAYIDYDALTIETLSQNNAPGKRVRSISMEPQVATGIEMTNDQFYTNKVLINGQFYILRGEKMYDATGRLVK